MTCPVEGSKPSAGALVAAGDGHQETGMTTTGGTTTLADSKSGEMLIDWLRDAHAMEKQAEQMLSNTARRIENYPELKARLERHLDQTRRQADLVRSCIERLGGLFVGDEVVKGSMASYVFEQMEIASYRTLMAAAEHCGNLET
jgi:ferritin-like metal-binding protein YciE